MYGVEIGKEMVYEDNGTQKMVIALVKGGVEVRREEHGKTR